MENFITKAVFKPGELELMGERVILAPPTAFPELSYLAPVEEEDDDADDKVEEYLGPTIEDIQREVEEYKKRWEAEKEVMIITAKAKADGIIEEAEEASFREIKRATDEAASIKKEAQDEAERIIVKAQNDARQHIEESHALIEGERREAEEQGHAAGHEAGFEEGRAEVERLVERLHLMMHRAQEKRGEILVDSEQEIVNLVLLMARKVVKVISENQRNVIVSNVAQALRKVKAKGNIIVRVNLADLKLTTEHTKNFISLVEGVKSFQVIEDSSVDSGGCIIETDFGEIDARISSQLAELEAKILEISPLKAKAKSTENGG